MSKRYSGKSFNDSSLNKKENLILKIKETYSEKENGIGKKETKKKNILILKERKNFLKRKIQNRQDLPTTLNTLEKSP